MMTIHCRGTEHPQCTGPGAGCRCMCHEREPRVLGLDTALRTLRLAGLPSLSLPDTVEAR